jgi:hypothetical protein
MKSVADLAREAGFDVDSMGQIYPMDDESCSDNIERLLALHKAEVIKELCADEEPVAWRTFDGEGGYDFRGYEWNEDYQSRWDANNPKHIGWVDALYPAETVAALKARVAELETALQRLVDNLAEGEFISLTRIDEAREALRSKK